MEREDELKWEYIHLISTFDPDDFYGSNLIKLFNRYNRPNTQEVTFEEAKEFYEELVNNRQV